MRSVLSILAGATALFAATAASAQPVGPAGAQYFLGHPTAVDGATLAFGQYRVFLFGIDTVNATTFCRIDGVAWQCPAASVRSLDAIVGQGEVRCDVMGEPDYLGRYVGICHVLGLDVAEEQVKAGFAWANQRETYDYYDEEEAARAAGVGFWQGRIL